MGVKGVGKIRRLGGFAVAKLHVTRVNLVHMGSSNGAAPCECRAIGMETMSIRSACVTVIENAAQIPD